MAALKIGLNSQGRLLVPPEEFKAIMASRIKRFMMLGKSKYYKWTLSNDIGDLAACEKQVNIPTSKKIPLTPVHQLDLNQMILMKAYLSAKKDVSLLQCYAALKPNTSNYRFAVFEKTHSKSLKTDWRLLAFF